MTFSLGCHLHLSISLYVHFHLAATYIKHNFRFDVVSCVGGVGEQYRNKLFECLSQMFSEVFEVTYVAPILPNAVLEFAANNITKKLATVAEVNIISEASIYVIVECIHSNRKKYELKKLINER